ncbi:MAG: hypothetical protein HYR85_19755 [Planctomycetes bacterium]|nr:hypothetical protein [Planctomycetota bacterium]
MADRFERRVPSPHRGPLRAALLLAIAGAACASRALAPPSPTPVAADPPAPAAPPTSVDLRPRLLAWNLGPRAQGPRGTCSVFTTCESIEVACALHDGSPRRLSVEFLNWAGGQAAGAPSDGNFFHNAIAGFERFGLCSEDAMPYRAAFDPNVMPSPEALAEAAAARDSSRESMVVHWIVPWQAARFGVSNSQLAEIRETIARGYPVAAGSGHSRLLVGYRDDASREGGGVFVTEDSALARFDEVTYDFVRKQVADVFWIEARDVQLSSR